MRRAKTIKDERWAVFHFQQMVCGKTCTIIWKTGGYVNGVTCTKNTFSFGLGDDKAANGNNYTYNVLTWRDSVVDYDERDRLAGIEAEKRRKATAEQRSVRRLKADTSGWASMANKYDHTIACTVFSLQDDPDESRSKVRRFWDDFDFENATFLADTDRVKSKFKGLTFDEKKQLHGRYKSRFSYSSDIPTKTSGRLSWGPFDNDYDRTLCVWHSQPLKATFQL